VSGRIPFRVISIVDIENGSPPYPPSFSPEKLLTAHLVLLTQLIITQPNHNI